MDPAGNETFSYDSIGNRISDQLGSYTYDAFSQQLTEDWQYNYTYDNNGNLIAKIPKDTTKSAYTFTYNSKNQLVRVQTTSSALGPVIKDISYNYDVLGRRMEKKITDLVDSTKSYSRRFVYDGDNILFEYDGSSQMLASYTHSGLAPDDVLSASITSAGVTAGLASSQGHYYFLKDALSTVTEIINPSGSIVQKYDYGTFGKILSIKDGNDADISANPSLRTSFTFTGREWDEESGLFYYRARYYDPSIGRFLQTDTAPGHLSNPIGVTNKYIYAANSPTEFRDPSGTSIFSEIAGNIVGFGHGLIGATGAGFDQLIKNPSVQLAAVIIAAVFIGPEATSAVASSVALTAFLSGAASWYRGNRSWEAFRNGASQFLGNPTAVRNSAIIGLAGYGLFQGLDMEGFDTSSSSNVKFFAGIYSANYVVSQLPQDKISPDEDRLWYIIGFLLPYY
jgi:RHS repeat-associated protein